MSHVWENNPHHVIKVISAWAWRQHIYSRKACITNWRCGDWKTCTFTRQGGPKNTLFVALWVMSQDVSASAALSSILFSLSLVTPPSLRKSTSKLPEWGSFSSACYTIDCSVYFSHSSWQPLVSIHFHLHLPHAVYHVQLLLELFCLTAIFEAVEAYCSTQRGFCYISYPHWYKWDGQNIRNTCQHYTM